MNTSGRFDAFASYRLRFPFIALMVLGLFLIGLGPGCGPSTPSEETDGVASDSLATAVQSLERSAPADFRVRTGAERLIEEELDRLQGKRVAIVANPTACLPDGTHLVDTLMSLGVDIRKVFGPEHGFRGDASAGTKVKSMTDEKTGLPILSLYGASRKPTPAQLEDVDVVIFDIQDVGSRHYTYIYTMTFAMEACAENGKTFMVLDRPNPNGWYVDGPVLEDAYSSFIGMHEIPIVHGMTVGEYAQLVNGEGWLEGGVQATLEVIRCDNYTHRMRWEDTGLEWIPPSPNLATPYAAYLYPALCWLEPTTASVGRGTDEAFTIVGAPWFQGLQVPNARTTTEGVNLNGLVLKTYEFTPRSLPGKAENPKFQDQACQGYQFSGYTNGRELFLTGLALLQSLYEQGKDQGTFFRKGFEKWPGNATLKQQVIDGVPPETIYQSWQAELTAFKGLRSEYLIYP